MLFLQYALKNLNFSRIMSYYAVANGRQIGIYDSWAKCEEQVKGFKCAKYKKFPTRQAAQKFIDEVQNVAGSSQLKRKVDAEAEFWPANKISKNAPNELSDDDLLKVALAAEKQIPAGTVKVATRQDKPPVATKQGKSTVATAKSYVHSDNVFRHRSKIWHPVSNTKIGEYDFLLDMEGFVICYTDGSCVNNGKRTAYAGYGVYFGDEHPLNASNPVKGRATNNVGEIQAAIHAIKSGLEAGIPKLCVSTDSQFLINSVISWMAGWKQKNWKLKDGGPVKNASEFKELDKLLQNDNIIVKWNYVKAHVGIKGNEMADQLARIGAEIFRDQKLPKFKK